MWLKSDENYLRFDEKSNTYDSLEKLSFFLDNIQNNLNFWKWAIIALHNSLYGAMILALQGSNQTRVIEINKAFLKELKKKYGITQINVNDCRQIGKIWQLGRLITFPEAFKRIQQEKYMKLNNNSNVFRARENYSKAIKFINEYLRNSFMHFKPGGWSIYIENLKEIFKDCLEIIEFCLFQSGNVRLEENERQLFQEILKKIKTHKKLLL